MSLEGLTLRPLEVQHDFQDKFDKTQIENRSDIIGQSVPVLDRLSA